MAGSAAAPRTTLTAYKLAWKTVGIGGGGHELGQRAGYEVGREMVAENLSSDPDRLWGIHALTSIEHVMWRARSVYGMKWCRIFELEYRDPEDVLSFSERADGDVPVIRLARCCVVRELELEP